MQAQKLTLSQTDSYGGSKRKHPCFMPAKEHRGKHFQRSLAEAIGIEIAFSTMKLYFAPRTNATRSRWLLEELEIPYELVKLDLAKEENKTSDYLAINPLGEVPALVDGELTLLEPSAICLYLVDRFPEKQLAPPPGSSDRGMFLQWLLFTESTLRPEVMAFYKHAQLPEEQKTIAHAQQALTQHRVRLDALLDVIDTQLRERDFLVAGHFTAADLVLASILHLANHLKLLDNRPKLVTYIYLHCQRPASIRAVA
jgi:glutathione S-transferase